MSLSPSVGWIYHNPDTGIEFSEDHPVKSGMVDDATHIRPATAENLKSTLLDAWAALDEHRSAEGDWMRKCFDARTEVERLTKERDAEHEDALEKNRLWGIQCEKVAKFEHERAALEARAQSAEAELAEMREAARKLANAASRLAIAAQTTGGVAGRDEGLCVAIDRIAHPLGALRSLVEKEGARRREPPLGAMDPRTYDKGGEDEAK